jgi:transposase
MWDQKNPSAIVQVLPYGPPNSPELSPIENLWAWAQAKVGHSKPRLGTSQGTQAGCQSFKETIQGMCLEDIE